MASDPRPFTRRALASARELLGPDGPFAAEIANFTPRDCQQQMAEAVEEAIRDDPNPGNKQRKPEEYLENGPLDQLVASGFTKQFQK